MHCRLVVPELLVPELLSTGGPGNPPIELPALQSLLARGRRDARPGAVREHWWLEVFGVERQHDLPAAPYRLLGDAGQPGDSAWLCADPVHMRADRDSVALADADGLGLTAGEARSLADAVNAHFEGRLAVTAATPSRWYARSPAPSRIRTVPTSAARARSMGAHLPRGEDAMAWHALMNEAQMLLHDHPVNQAREARGELPVNGLWIWGAGRLASLAPRPAQAVFATDPLVLGLARESGMGAAPLPARAADWLHGAPENGVVWFALDALATPADYADATRWQDALRAMEADWFAPMLAALRSGRIGMLTLDALSLRGCLRVEAVRGDLRRFWRRAKPLSAWAPAADAPSALEAEAYADEPNETA